MDTHALVWTQAQNPHTHRNIAVKNTQTPTVSERLELFKLLGIFTVT